jgi:hypothetical protein
VTFTQAGQQFWQPRFERHGFDFEIQMFEHAFEVAVAEVLVAEMMTGRMVLKRALSEPRPAALQSEVIRLALGIPQPWPPKDTVGNLVPVDFQARPAGSQAPNAARGGGTGQRNGDRDARSATA